MVYKDSVPLLERLPKMANHRLCIALPRVMFERAALLSLDFHIHGTYCMYDSYNVFIDSFLCNCKDKSSLWFVNDASFVQFVQRIYDVYANKAFEESPQEFLDNGIMPYGLIQDYIVSVCGRSAFQNYEKMICDVKLLVAVDNPVLFDSVMWYLALLDVKFVLSKVPRFLVDAYVLLIADIFMRVFKIHDVSMEF